LGLIFQTVLIDYAPAGLGGCDFTVFHPASRDVGILRPFRAWNFDFSRTFEDKPLLLLYKAGLKRVRI
jgi:hypothetical protein